MKALQARRLGPWEWVLGYFVEHPLVSGLLAIFLLAAAWFVAPFAWDAQDLPRAPLAVDAIPDVGEHQQIVFTQWPGRSPQEVEDQVTFPLTSALLGTPGVRSIRSSSAFGFSTIYVIFDDEADFYGSRSRLSERLASLEPNRLPQGVAPRLGPDATALGQVFWYTLEGQDEAGRSVGGWDLHELRSVQDWMVRPALQAARGVSEVASIGGHVREYQVNVDPLAMRSFEVSLAQVAKAVQNSNLDIGARSLEINRVEYLLRGLGRIERLEDLEQAVVVARDHTPVRIMDVAQVSMGPALRRGALDDEGAPAVGGVVTARYMENPVEVIAAVKAQISLIQASLPSRTLEDGTRSQLRIVPFYDRTELIESTLNTVSSALYQEILITVVVVVIMLGSLRASLLVSSMLPLGVAGAFVGMKILGVGANVMALGGIAIAIGTMVDIGIVFVENIIRKLEEENAPEQGAAGVVSAVAEVAPAVLTSVLTTIVSFLPVLGLSATEYRLFAPLVLTKTFAMSAAFLVSLLFLPSLAAWLHRGSAKGTVRVSWARFFSGSALRSGLLLALGLFLCSRSIWLGVVALLLGAWPLLAARLPSTWSLRGAAIKPWLVVGALMIALSLDWMPLHQSRGEVWNTLFVVVLVALVLGFFRYFERVYPRCLRKLLARKRLFSLAPISLCLLGLLAWLGAPALFHDPAYEQPQNTVSRWVHSLFPGLGREYMPAFDEGAFLYMPTTMPHASIGAAQELMSQLDAAIAEIPEVDRVVGKLGRADSALDPAPISMIESLITYHPEYRTNKSGERVRVWRDHIQSKDDIWKELLEAAKIPGLTGAPVLMPISARMVMLQSGMRAPLGLKIRGTKLESIEAFGLELESLLRKLPSIRSESVFADRVVAKPYLEIKIDRQAIARYGLSIADIQSVIQVAVGGKQLSEVIEGRERYALRLRYAVEYRNSIEAIRQVLVPVSGEEQIPLGLLATIRYAPGPAVIKSEDTFLTSYVLFDARAGVSQIEVVRQAQAHIEAALESKALVLPEGVSYSFAGSYKSQLRSEGRLKLLIPAALLLVLLLLYLQFRRLSLCLMIFSSAAVAMSGGFLLLWLYGQPWFLDFEILGLSMRGVFQVRPVNLSVAVWVGFIALLGIATDDGVVMSTYLEQSFSKDRPKSIAEIRARVLDAGLRRVRPCLMTTATTILALLLVVASQGRGADLMMPMALPCLGGMGIEVLTLFVLPVLYCAQQERRWRLRLEA